MATAHWSAFIRATIACGASRVTGHVLIDGVETTKISGKPVTVKLSPGYAKVIHERRSRSYWTLYVDPTVSAGADVRRDVYVQRPDGQLHLILCH